MAWPRAPEITVSPQISLRELCGALGQEKQAASPCALPFFPGINSWAVEEASSERKSCALFYKGNN